MSRAPFNTDCDVYAGPGTGTPNALVASVDCRFVPQTGITLVGGSSPVRVAWVTMKDYQPTGGWDFPPMGFRPSIADRIAIPHGGPPQWWVLYVEEVFWKAQPLYYRANVAHLPAPPDGGHVPGGGGGPWSLGNLLLILGDENELTASSSGRLILGSASSIVVPSPSGPLFLRNEP